MLGLKNRVVVQVRAKEVKIMFEFKITLDDDDYLLFNQYHLLNSPFGKRNLLIYKMLIPVVCFIFLVAVFIANPDFQLLLIETILMTILSILWVGYSKKVLIRSMEKGFRKMKKEGRLPYSNESIIKFDDESIHEITPDTEIKTKYSVVEKVVVTDKAIYIYYSPSQAYVLPVTVFSEDAEKQKFLEFINSKINSLKDTKQA